MALTEVGARLRLAGAPAFRRDADKAAGGLDKLGREAGKADKKVGALGRGMRGLGKATAAGLAGAATAFTAFAIKGLRDASDLDTKLREVNTLFGLTGEAGAKNFGDLQKLVKSLSQEVGMAQVTLTEGLYNAISAGVPKDNAFEFMKTSAKFATAGVTDVNTAVEGLTGVLNAFGKPASEAESVADMFFTTIKGGITTADQLAANISNIAPAAAAAGVSMQEVGAAIATLTSNKVPTAQATTMLRAALAGLQKPSKDLDRIFGKLGYRNAQVAIESKGLGFALDVVKKASKGNNGELQKLLGSVEAVGAANIIAGVSADKFRDEMEAQNKAAGATSTAFDEMDKSAGRTFEKLRVKLQNVGIDLGNYLLPKILKLADEFERGAGTGGKIRDALTQIGDEAREAWPQIKGVFDSTKDIVGFIQRNQGVFETIAVGVGAYALAMKAAQFQTALMALHAPKAAVGITATGAAATGATAGMAAYALPFAAAAAGAYAWVKWLEHASGSSSNTASTRAGLPTATIGNSPTRRSDGSFTPVVPTKPVTFDGKTFAPIGSDGKPGQPLGGRGPATGRAELMPAQSNVKTTVVIPVVLNGRQVGEAVIDDLESRAARR